jgi:SPP1 gp7 family putative phage head morphogenesis protein
MLNFSFSQTPDENIAYLLSKKREAHFNYSEMMFEAHHAAFTVAKITKADLLLDIQASLIRAQKDGITFEQWQKEIRPTLEKKGWWGLKQIMNPKTGEFREVNIGARRLRTIFETNMRTANAQARANAQYSGYAEYLRYVAIMDSRTREEHRSLHGTILHRDSEFWEENYPPNGWGCRCRVDAWTKSQIEKRGWEIQEDAPEWFEADKDWAYDTRNLQPDDNAISRTIKQKVAKLTKTDDPDKIIRAYLNESLGELKTNRQLYKDVQTLFAEAVAYPKTLKESPIDSKKVTIANATPKLQEQLATKAKYIFLTGWTIRTHVHHKDITPFHYYLTKHMLSKPYKTEKDGEFHVAYFSKLGKYYKAVFKKAVNAQGKDEIYLVSLFSSSKKL